MFLKLLSCLLCTLFSSFCYAHEPFEITATARVTAERITINALITDTTAAKLCLSGTSAPSHLHEAELANAHVQIKHCVANMFVLTDGEANPKTLSVQGVQLRLTEEKDLEATINYAPCVSGKLTVTAVYFAQLKDPSYGGTLTATTENTFLVQKLLMVDDPQVKISLAETQTPTQSSFGDFFRLGVAHILTGYDHLLFLAALLIVCMSLRSSLIIITAFTLGHSISLALATLKLVSIASNLVETAIAVSIIFVGVENLWRTRKTQEPQWRWLLTFGFGLIHGLGFASVLLAAGLPSSGMQLIAPLLAFNIGVEVGQLGVAAIALPVIFWLRRYSWFSLRAVPGVSVLVVIAGLFWLLERLNIV